MRKLVAALAIALAASLSVFMIAIQTLMIRIAGRAIVDVGCA